MGGSTLSKEETDKLFKDAFDEFASVPKVLHGFTVPGGLQASRNRSQEPLVQMDQFGPLVQSTLDKEFTCNQAQWDTLAKNYEFDAEKGLNLAILKKICGDCEKHDQSAAISSHDAGFGSQIRRLAAEDSETTTMQSALPFVPIGTFALLSLLALVLYFLIGRRYSQKSKH